MNWTPSSLTPQKVPEEQQLENIESKKRENSRNLAQRRAGWTEDCKYCDSQRKLAEFTCFACEKDIEETEEEAEKRREEDEKDPIRDWSASTFKDAIFESVHKAQRALEGDVKSLENKTDDLASTIQENEGKTEDRFEALERRLENIEEKRDDQHEGQKQTYKQICKEFRESYNSGSQTSTSTGSTSGGQEWEPTQLEIKGFAIQGDRTGRRIDEEEYKEYGKALLETMPQDYRKHFKLDDRPFAQSWQINFKFARRL